MKNKLLILIKFLFMILSLGLSSYLIFKIDELNMIPSKYFALIVSGIALINIRRYIEQLIKQESISLIGIIRMLIDLKLISITRNIVKTE